MTKGRKIVSILASMMIFATCFVIVGSLTPLFVEIITPSTSLLKVINIDIDYNENAASVLKWHRWAAEDMYVMTYLDLEKINNGDQEIWHKCYTNFFQEGDHDFVFSINDFPDHLEPGRYQIVGSSVFYTSLGVRKSVPFFSPIFVVK